MPRLRLSAFSVSVLGVCALLTAGCTHGTSPSSGPVTAAVRTALAAWARFPVHASPRPLVLTGGTVNAPSAGFRSGADKDAFLEGAITPPQVFPGGPRTADGYGLVSARAAFHALVAAKVTGPPATSQLVATSVTLGTASFDTDRGSRVLPSWNVGFEGVEGPAAVLAVAPARIFTGPRPLDEASAVGSATVGSGGRTLTVHTAGAPAGTGPCTASYSMDVGASDAAVAVQVHVSPHGGSVPCAIPAVSVRLTTTLADPLGNRVLVDASSLAAVAVTAADH